MCGKINLDKRAKVQVKRNQNTDEADPEHQVQYVQQAFGFLFFGYKAQSYYWEIIVVLRKTTMALIGVVLNRDIRLKGIISMFLIIFALLLHVRKVPHNSRDMF